jgi:hypothetical protein
MPNHHRFARLSSVKSIFKIFSGVFIFTLFLSSQAFSAQAEYPAGSDIAFKNIIATININLEEDADGISVAIKDGEESYKLDHALKGGTVLIEGPKKPKSRPFQRETRGRGPLVDRVERWLADYPVITITAPEGSDIKIENFIASLKVSGDAGEVVLKNSIYAGGEFGNIASGKIGVGGSGSLVFGDIASNLKASIGGSGKLTFGNGKNGSFSIGGSGDIIAGKFSGPASASIGGSGTIIIEEIGGDGEFSIAGSGDIRTGPVNDGIHASISGSGDIRIAKINGPATASIVGSGDVRIDDGKATQLSVSIVGSGDFVFNGEAVDPGIAILGSGDVTIGSYSGDLSIRGNKNDVHIGKRN